MVFICIKVVVMLWWCTETWWSPRATRWWWSQRRDAWGLLLSPYESLCEKKSRRTGASRWSVMILLSVSVRVLRLLSILGCRHVPGRWEVLVDPQESLSPRCTKQILWFLHRLRGPAEQYSSGKIHSWWPVKPVRELSHCCVVTTPTSAYFQERCSAKQSIFKNGCHRCSPRLCWQLGAVVLTIELGQPTIKFTLFYQHICLLTSVYDHINIGVSGK